MLNFMNYRDRDYTAKDRMRALRDRRKTNGTASPTESVTPNGRNVPANRRNVPPIVTHSREQMAEAEAEAEAQAKQRGTKAPSGRGEFDRFWSAYPKKKSKGDAERAFSLTPT